MFKLSCSKVIEESRLTLELPRNRKRRSRSSKAGQIANENFLPAS